MALTTIGNMAIVPEKFTGYVLERTTEKSAMVQAGIATPDERVATILNNMPEGGRFVTMPHFNPLDANIEDDVFGEGDVSIENITSGDATATILMRQKAWGATDLSHVLSGGDPMAAVGNAVSDWWLSREQRVYLAILKALLDPAAGALKDHVNDVTGATGALAGINVDTALDTKQLMGDHYDALGIVFMHSATFTQLQKQQDIVTEYDSNLMININFYLGYRVVVDDGMPFSGTGADKVFDTYFMGAGAFARVDGAPAGFVGTETDRDSIGAKNYLINRRAMIIHPRGLSWVNKGNYTKATDFYPANADLANPANWELALDAKKVPIVALRHKLAR